MSRSRYLLEQTLRKHPHRNILLDYSPNQQSSEGICQQIHQQTHLQKIRMLCQLADGLNHLHRLKITHNNLTLSGIRIIIEEKLIPTLDTKSFSDMPKVARPYYYLPKFSKVKVDSENTKQDIRGFGNLILQTVYETSQSEVIKDYTLHEYMFAWGKLRQFFKQKELIQLISECLSGEPPSALRISNFLHQLLLKKKNIKGELISKSNRVLQLFQQRQKSSQRNEQISYCEEQIQSLSLYE